MSCANYKQQSPGIYSSSGRTSYHKISWSLETTKLGVMMFISLCRKICSVSYLYKFSVKMPLRISDWLHNSLRPTNAIWQHSFGSKLAQIIACCLTAQNLNGYLLLLNQVRWYSRKGNSIAIPLTKASCPELWCFLWSAPERTSEQTNSIHRDADDLRRHRTHYDVAVMNVIRGCDARF